MRKRRTPQQRLKLFLAQGGICYICRIKIKVGEKWQEDHERALSLLGADDEGNLRIAHVHCHAAKTAVDFGRLAKAKRTEAKHRGAYEAKRPLPFGRGSKWKRKIGGKVVLR
jgi:5-methylcytosine-specific restriction protein A